MPKLSDATEALRTMQAMSALQLIIRGINKEAACTEVGLSVWQFDQWVATENTALEELQHAIVETERIRLTQLANAQAILLTKLLSNVTMDGYGDHDMQLKVLKYIDKLRGDLEDKHGVHSQHDNADEYVLAGPQTRVEESKMSVQHEMSRSVVNIKTNPDGSVDLTIPNQVKVIDMFPELGSGEEEELLLPAAEE